MSLWIVLLIFEHESRIQERNGDAEPPRENSADAATKKQVSSGMLRHRPLRLRYPTNT